MEGGGERGEEGWREEKRGGGRGGEGGRVHYHILTSLSFSFTKGIRHEKDTENSEPTTLSISSAVKEERGEW